MLQAWRNGQNIDCDIPMWLAESAPSDWNRVDVADIVIWFGRIPTVLICSAGPVLALLLLPTTCFLSRGAARSVSMTYVKRYASTFRSWVVEQPFFVSSSITYIPDLYEILSKSYTTISTTFKQMNICPFL